MDIQQVSNCDLSILKPETATLTNKQGVKLILTSEIPIELYEKFFDIEEGEKSAKNSFIENKKLLMEMYSANNDPKIVNSFFKGLSMPEYIYISNFTVTFFKHAFGQKKS